MKTLIKDLPAKRDIKDFYNLNKFKNYTVKKVHINRTEIMLDCIIKDRNKYVNNSFYQEICFVNFKRNEFSLVIRRKYWDHLIENIILNLNYIKQTAKMK